MLDAILGNSHFKVLAHRFGDQIEFLDAYCPFISFQTNYLTCAAARLVDRADLVFVKGANFFETLQLVEKKTFYAFVVYGPVSRACTGLSDYDAVWAYVPAGMSGYEFSNNGAVERTLCQTVGNFSPKSTVRMTGLNN